MKKQIKKAISGFLAACMLITSSPIYAVDNTSVDNVVESESNEIVNVSESDIYIRQLSTQLFYGATETDDGYVWTPTNQAAGHRFSYRINYAISGVDEAQVETIEFVIPKNILKNRDNAFDSSYEMSIPSKDEVEAAFNGTGESIDNDINYAYYEDGDNIIIYNFRTVPAGDNGYIEVSYYTTSATTAYVDMEDQIPFTCTMTVTKEENKDTKTADPINLKIDTTAKITSTQKKYPTKYTTWQSSWGTAVKPENSNEYYYLEWVINSNVTATQPYDFVLEDNITGNFEGMEVLGYKFAGQGSYSESNTVTNKTTTGYRYDYVLTAIPLDTYLSETYWRADNIITATVIPVDKIDAATSANGSRTWTWTKPVFKIPTGHFNVYKRADGAYRTYSSSIFTGTTHKASSINFKAAEYTRYDLEQFNGYDDTVITLSEMDKFDYASWIVGYPYPWTYDSSYNNPLNPEAYGKIPVTYQLIDEGLYLTNDAEGEDLEKSEQLTSSDFYINKLEYSWYMRDAIFDEENQVFTESAVQYTDNDILTFYGKFGTTDDWIEFGSYNLKTKEKTYNENYVSSMTTNSFIFNDNANLIAYKVETTNAHYYTEIFTVPYITLKDSDTVKNFIADKPVIGILNNNEAHVYDSDNNEIFTGTKSDTDFARISQRDSSLTKSVVAVSNNTKKKNYTITWKISQKETVIWGENGIVDYIPQDGGVFYDLLPAGSVVDKNSVDVEVANGRFLASSAYTVSTIENYNNTGRTMLIVKINQEASYYNVYFDTIHSWNSIKDYGTGVYNPVAYETGNESITNGFPDNGGQYLSDGSKNKDAIKEAELMASLDKNVPDNNDSKERKFIYSEQTWDISAITSASAGLMKKVKEEDETEYSYETTTSINGEYSYQLRFMNSYTSSSENMIFFDSLENYDTETKRDYGTESDWHGTLQSIDVSQLKEKGIAPVIYISTISALDIEENHDLTDSSVWTKVTDSTDLSTAKAIAIDMRKTTDGTDFKLDAGDSVNVCLYMKAPSEAPSTDSGYAYTYNNIYISDTVFNMNDSENGEDFLIHQDYTSVKLLVTGSFGIEKVSSESENITIPDIQFRLLGTSDYGTSVDKILTTDTNGTIYFKNIEMGTYILQEYQSTDDWLLDTTEHTVIIDNQGSVTIDGEDYTNDYITLTNNPRIHGDFSFYKKELNDDSFAVADAKFMLTGISSYGNEVTMYATSLSNGQVTFSNVELGTYKLKEVSTNKNYLLNNITYTVTCDETGTVSITDSDEEVSLSNSIWYNKTKTGKETIYNEYRYWDFTIRKIDEENTSIWLEGATFNLSGISDLGTAVDISATTNTNGLVQFTGIEKGTYILKEISAPIGIDDTGKLGGNRNYIADPNEYIVNIDFEGKVTIEGLEIEDETGYFLIQNSRALDGSITVIKIWNDDLTNEERPIPKLHLTTLEPKVEINENVKTALERMSEELSEESSSNILTSVISSISPKIYAATITYSGTSGTCSWSIDSDGLLTIYPTDGVSGILDSNTANNSSFWPWYQYNSSITKVVVEDNVFTNTSASYLFYNLANCTEIELSKLNTSNATNMESIFAYCNSLTSLDLSNFKTDNVTNMSYMFSYCSSLTSLNLSSLNTINVTNMSNIFAYCISLTSLDVSNFDTRNVTNMSYMFYYCNFLTSLDLSSFDTSKVTNMSCMFEHCGSLTNLDLSSFYTINVTNMGNLFCDCVKLTSLDLSNFNTSKVTNMSYMFCGCIELTSLDLSNFNTSNVTNMSYMFNNCRSLTNLDLNNFNTIKVINMNSIFSYCSSLTSIDLNSFNTSNVTNMSYMFTNCSSLTNLDLSSFDTSNVTNMSYMFNNCNSLTDLDLSNFNTSKVTNMIYMFANCSSLTSLDVSSFDTSKVTNMLWMFTSCKSLTDIDLSSFNTSNVTNMSYVFAYCNSLTSLDVSSFDTSKVTNMSYMFNNCNSLTSLDLSNFKTSNVIYMNYMFANCSSLTSLDLSNFKTDNVTSMANMFYYCNSLTSLDVSSFNTSKVTTMQAMFEWCSALSNLDVSNFDTSKVTNMLWMFAFCKSLTDIDLSSFNTSNVTNMSGMFEYCSSLTSLDLSNFNTSKVTSMSSMFTNCTSLVSLNLSSFDTSKAYMGYMFDYETSSSDRGALPSLSKIILGDTFKFNGTDHYFINTNWVKTRDVDGTKIYDNTEYTGEEIAALTADTIPSIGGTWCRYGIESYVINPDGSVEFISEDDKWVKDGDVWTYTFKVFDDTLQYYLYEEEIEGYTSNAMAPSYIVVDKTTKTATITNTADKNIGALEISKRVTNSVSDNKFMFTLELSGEKIGGTQIFSGVIFTDGIGVFYLSDKETKVFNDLPAGTIYKVTEKEDYFYEQQEQGTTGTIIENETQYAVITNTYTIPIESQINLVNIKLQKEADGRYEESELNMKIFNFVVSFTGLIPNINYVLSDGTTFTADSNGNAFVNITLKANEQIMFLNIPVGATYQITEDAGDYISSYTISDANNKNLITNTGDSNTEENKQLSTSIETADKDEEISVIFRNKLSYTGNLEIGKKTAQYNNEGVLEDIDCDDSFEITVDFYGLEENESFSSTIGRVKADEEGIASKTFYLKNSESVNFYNIPVGVQYMVTESSNKYIASYTVTGSLVESSYYKNESNRQALSTELETINHDSNDVVTFINIKDNTKHNITINFTKEIQGTDIEWDYMNLNKDDNYNFMISLINTETGNTYNGILNNKGILTFFDIPIGTYNILESDDNYFDFVKMESQTDIEEIVFTQTQEGAKITISENLFDDISYNINVINKIEDNHYYEEKDEKDNLFLVNE